MHLRIALASVDLTVGPTGTRAPPPALSWACPGRALRTRKHATEAPAGAAPVGYGQHSGVATLVPLGEIQGFQTP